VLPNPPMARSIHTTRKTLRHIRRQDFSDPDEKAAVLRKARQQLRQKRIIKWRTELERSGIEVPVAGTRVELIPIDVCDQGPYVHHVCSEADIRAVLSALPEAAVEGISRIQLGLGKAYHEESRRGKEDQADPFTGRRSGEVFPGVYSGMILGVYQPRNAVIHLHAFVFDPKELPFEADLVCLYLRLHALATLVHEVAHHHDSRERVGRGRWIFDRYENVEGYAEKMEYFWSREVVLAYLQRTYESKTSNLLGNLDINYRIAKGLVFKTSIGYNRLQCDEISITPGSSQTPNPPANPEGSSNFGKITYNSWIAEPQLEYNRYWGFGKISGQLRAF